MNEKILLPVFQHNVILELKNKIEELSNDIAYIETILRMSKNKRIHDIVAKNFEKRKERQYKEFNEFYTKYSKFLLKKNGLMEQDSFQYQELTPENENNGSDSISTCSTAASEEEQYKLLIDMYDKKKKITEVLHLIEASGNDFLADEKSLEILHELTKALKSMSRYVADFKDSSAGHNSTVVKKTQDKSKGKEKEFKKEFKKVSTKLDDQIINYLYYEDASFPDMGNLTESSLSIDSSNEKYANCVGGTDKKCINTKVIAFKVTDLLNDNKTAMREKAGKNSVPAIGAKTSSHFFPSKEISQIDSSGNYTSNFIMNDAILGSKFNEAAKKKRGYLLNPTQSDNKMHFSVDANKNVHFNLQHKKNEAFLSKIGTEKYASSKDTNKSYSNIKINNKKNRKTKITYGLSSLPNSTLNADSNHSYERRSIYSSTSNSGYSSDSRDSSHSSNSSNSSDSNYDSEVDSEADSDSEEESFGRKKHTIKINREGKGVFFVTEEKGSSPKYINEFEIIYDNSSNEFYQNNGSNTNIGRDGGKQIFKLCFVQNGSLISRIKNLYILEDAQIKDLRFYDRHGRSSRARENCSYTGGEELGNKRASFTDNREENILLRKELSGIINNINNHKLRRLSKDPYMTETVETNRLRGIYLQLLERQRGLENERNFYKNELDVLNKNLNKILDVTNDQNKKINEINFQKSELLYKALEERFTNSKKEMQLESSQEINSKEKDYILKEKEMEKKITESQCELKMVKEQLIKEQAANENLMKISKSDKLTIENAERELMNIERFKEETSKVRQRCEDLMISLEAERKEKSKLSSEVYCHLNTIRMLENELNAIKADTTFDNFRKSVLLKVNNTNTEIQTLASQIELLTEELEIQKNKEKVLIDLLEKSEKECSIQKKDLKFTQKKLKRNKNIMNGMREEIDCLNIKIENLLDAVKFWKREIETHAVKNAETP